MNYASKELSAELYELMPEWETGRWYRLGGVNPNRDLPKYDLGYLLRKLPRTSVEGLVLKLWCDEFEIWYCGYYDSHMNADLKTESGADTPEDAACKLAIELAKQGVLTKKEVRGESK